MCHIENILKRIGRKRELPGRACMGHVAGQVEVSPESGSLTQSCPALATSLSLCEIRFPQGSCLTCLIGLECNLEVRGCVGKL